MRTARAREIELHFIYSVMKGKELSRTKSFRANGYKIQEKIVSVFKGNVSVTMPYCYTADLHRKASHFPWSIQEPLVSRDDIQEDQGPSIKNPGYTYSVCLSVK